MLCGQANGRQATGQLPVPQAPLAQPDGASPFDEYPSEYQPPPLREKDEREMRRETSEPQDSCTFSSGSDIFRDTSKVPHFGQSYS
jgi:hypothetical protein